MSRQIDFQVDEEELDKANGLDRTWLDIRPCWLISMENSVLARAVRRLPCWLELYGGFLVG